MLYPQRNKNRHFIDLSGFWDFRFDHDDKGAGENWAGGTRLVSIRFYDTMGAG